jgi:hypothetical protein
MTHTAGSPVPLARRRRRRRTIITLVLVVALLAGSMFVAVGYVQGWLGKHTETVTPKRCVPATTIRSSQVTLNVYNATQRSGLASKTASALRKRGFKIASVANDPLERKITGSSEVRYGPSGARAARLVADQVKGARMVRDSRSDTTLDLVIGDRFNKLAAPVTVLRPTPTKTKTTKPVKGAKAVKATKSTAAKTTPAC